MKLKQIVPILITMLMLSLPIKTIGQTGITPAIPPTSDSLTLNQVLQMVMQSHPSIKQAEEALNVADAKIGLAKSGYYPEVDFSASWAHLAPDPALTIPNLGSLVLFPKNNYNATFNINQTIYDFGKTSKGVKVENENKTIANDNIDLIKQNLTLRTVSTFYTLVYCQQAIRIKDEEIKTLQEHLVFIEKKQATGSATKYELLSTKVRISNTESQKLDLETFQNTQRSVINTLTGSATSNSQYLKQELKVELPTLSSDSLLSYAFAHRVEMVLAKEKQTLVQFSLDVVKTQNAPILSAFASGGFKNGYEHNMTDLYNIYGNYVVGFGLKIPIFDKNRHKYNLAQAQSNLTSVGFETDLSQRAITNEVIEANANCAASKKKIDQFELQLAQAQEAHELAQVSFKSGVITNLDLLDSETSVSESQLLLLKSRIDYIVNSYKLKIALGEKL